MDWSSPEISGYAYGVARKNLWRFHGTVDAEDLVQEFALGFLAVQKMADPSKGPRAFMALFKNRVHWILTDRTRRYCRRSENMPLLDNEESRHASVLNLVEDPTRGGMPELEARLLLQSAPEPVQRWVEAQDLGTARQKGERPMAAIRRITGLSAPAYHRILLAWLRACKWPEALAYASCFFPGDLSGDGRIGMHAHSADAATHEHEDMTLAKKIDVTTELVNLTGIKRASGETFQAWARKVVKKAYALPEDTWDDLSQEAFDWLESCNKFIKQPNVDLPVFEGAVGDDEADETPEEAPEEEADEDDAVGSDDDVIDEPEEEPEEEPESVKPAPKAKASPPPSVPRKPVLDEPEEEEEEVEEEKPAPKAKAAKAAKVAPAPPPAVTTPAKRPSSLVTKPRDDRPTSQSVAFREMMLRNWGLTPAEYIEMAAAEKITLAKLSMESIYHHSKYVIGMLEEIYGIQVPKIDSTVASPTQAAPRTRSK